jgi:DNA-binding transcriptional ArsR family regulator
MQKTNCFFIFLKGNQMVAYNVSGMDAVFKALADASRRKLLDQLRAENGQTLGDLCAHLDMTRQAVSKHLAILEAANLVVAVWSGREKLHYLNPVPIHEIGERWIGKFEKGRLQALSEMKKALEEETGE